MTVKTLIKLLKKQDQNLEVITSDNWRQELYLLNENESCQCTIDLEYDELEEIKK